MYLQKQSANKSKLFSTLSLGFVFATFLLSFMFVSCSDDEDNKPSKPMISFSEIQARFSQNYNSMRDLLLKRDYELKSQYGDSEDSTAIFAHKNLVGLQFDQCGDIEVTPSTKGSMIELEYLANTNKIESIEICFVQQDHFAEIFLNQIKNAGYQRADFLNKLYKFEYGISEIFVKDNMAVIFGFYANGIRVFELLEKSRLMEEI